MSVFRWSALALVLHGLMAAQTTRVYVAAIEPESVTLAWGRTDGGSSQNTIGFAAAGTGPAIVRIAGRELTTDKSWLRVTGLVNDTSYPYSVQVGANKVGEGTVRTWAAKSDSLTFFVIGDWGNATSTQYRIARVMELERQAREKAGQPVRFILSTGDNIYGGGSEDRDWERKFFAPYADTLKAIPFYAVLGNHDGNESESVKDLPVYLDNFFFPGGKPARWYQFAYGGLVDFFALDSTRNDSAELKGAAYLPDGEQSAWLKGALEKPSLPWRIVYMHHPLFTAGPRHLPKKPELEHWLALWKQTNVSVVFAGHEHNLQISERNEATGGIQFIVSGAGGELRKGDVRGAMAQRNIAGWAPRAHFLVVEISGNTMTVTPRGDPEIVMKDPKGKTIPLPFKVNRR